MKGQYFSFDAIIASVIMVVAASSLVAYWFGAQSVVESRLNPMYADALRISDSLLSPGIPYSWVFPVQPGFNGVQQIGIASGFENTLNRSKLDVLASRVGLISGPGDTKYRYYLDAGKIMRATGNYFILVEQSDGGPILYEIGMRPPAVGAKEVAIAHRGAVLDGSPVRMRVFLWR